MPRKYLSSKLAKLILIVAVSCLLIFLNPKNFFSPFRNILLSASYPFEKIFFLASRKAGDTIEFLGSISRLQGENEKLLRENQFLVSDLATLNQEKKENESLREQLGLLPRKQFDLEAGSVIAQDPQKLGSWIIIDKGRTSGIKEGMPVIVSASIIVGEVSEIYPNSSKIDLLTDSTSLINGLDTDTSSRGIVKGEFGLGVVMDMVAQTDILNIGDDIATSGLGGSVPKGLLVGKIQEIKPTQDKLFQKALIIPAVKYSKLDTVFVIKN